MKIGSILYFTAVGDTLSEVAKGFNVSLEAEDFFKQVNEIGISIIGQTGNLAPADKKIYALRDVTATVDNISLIASSIMSKKLAAGSHTIVLDATGIILVVLMLNLILQLLMQNIIL